MSPKLGHKENHSARGKERVSRSSQGYALACQPHDNSREAVPAPASSLSARDRLFSREASGHAIKIFLDIVGMFTYLRLHVLHIGTDVPQASELTTQRLGIGGHESRHGAAFVAKPAPINGGKSRRR